MASSGKRFCSSIMRTKPWRANQSLDTRLNRCLSVFDLVMVGIGNTLGSGLFIITGTVVAKKSGPAIFLSFLIAGVNAFLNALTYAELGSRIPTAGSAYAYTYVASGEILAFLCGWMIILEYVLSIASVARGWSGTLNSLVNNAVYNATKQYIFKNYSPPSWLDNNPDILAFFMVICLGLIVATGPKMSANFNNFISCTSLFVILFTVIIMFSYQPVEPFANSQHGGLTPFGWIGVISGAGTCFFAFIGFDAVTIAAEEAENPKRDLPVAVATAVGLVTLIMTLASFALVWFQPWYLVDPTSAYPSALMWRGVVWAAIVIGVGALVSILASLFVCLFAMPRIVYAMSADGLLPQWLGYILPATKVPIVSLAIFGTMAAFLAAVFTLEELAEFLSIGTLLAYTIVNINLCILRYRNPAEYPPETQAELIATSVEEEGSDKTHLVGTLKPPFENVPGVKEFKPGHAALVALLVMTVLSAALCCFVLLGGRFIFVKKYAWAITLFVIFLGGFFLALIVMSIHQQNVYIKTFMMPGVPLLPAICITFNIVLIITLNAATWIRVAVWTTLGLLIYFFYGMHHSKENPEVVEKDPLLNGEVPMKSYSATAPPSTNVNQE